MNKYKKALLLIVSYIVVVLVTITIQHHITTQTVEVVQIERTDTGELITQRINNEYIIYYYEY